MIYADVTNFRPWFKKHKILSRILAFTYLFHYPLLYMIFSLYDHREQFKHEYSLIFKTVFFPWKDRNKSRD